MNRITRIEVIDENGRYCDSERKFHKCGMDGKLWEAK
jgi:hypothetical protein